MADKFGLFWNSENGDRLYDADSFAEWLSHFFTTGVFKDELFVQATEGMKVSVSSGYANVNGKVRFFGTSTNLNIEVSNGLYTIVVERNDTNREITLKVVKGNYSGNSPEATAPVRTNVIHQLVIAKVYIGAGATAIYQKDITDTRMDSNLCGYVTATVENLNYDQMMAQWEDYYSNFKTNEMADFQTWFDNMKNILNESTAGNLLEKINKNASDISKNATDIQNVSSKASSTATSITNLTSKVSTNTSNISKNTSDISTNKSNIGTNTSSINSLKTSKQDKAIKTTITLGTSWSSLTQSVSVSGITANHNAILDVVTSTSNYEAQQTEWAKVYKAETYNGGIKFYAKEATSTALTIQVLAM